MLYTLSLLISLVSNWLHFGLKTDRSWVQISGDAKFIIVARMCAKPSKMVAVRISHIVAILSMQTHVAMQPALGRYYSITCLDMIIGSP